MSLIVVLKCLAVFGTTLISAATVKWLPNSSFQLPDNFEDKKLPCSKQIVVFPQSLTGSIIIAPETEVSGFILPENGELILEGLINFGDNHAETNCTEENAYYLDKSVKAWNQTGVWSSPKFNKATPDSDRVPCFNDVVEFPENTKFTVILPKMTQYVKEIKVGSISYHSSVGFLIYGVILRPVDDQQQFVLNSYMTTNIKINKPVHCSQFGCACQPIPMSIDCASKFCPKAPCVHPVKPLGFCCKICGGYILFDPDETFDMKAFEDLVKDTVNGYDKNRIEYYVGFSPEIEFRRIQLVVVDKEEYEGLSAEITNSISYNLQNHWVKGHKIAQISGSPISKASLGGKMFVSMIFAVILTFGTLYVYYYQIVDLRFSILSGRMPDNIFSRLERRSESVVSLTRRDSMTSSRSSTGFRNPLYNSKRGRVQVVESED
ncbi:hypothetical protein PYW08_014457 [Mythimna loreyi]|uniref:Uncharacterized protein n=1 Tax=Mythimna loreyi TaxID=667449 RepID=A0ACC2R2G6_9NEOP|nr:hypothetical protein PYW08_014457 [Mythimna loreyi]